MKTSEFRVLVYMMLPAVLLLNQCAPNAVKTTQTASAATSSSRHWVMVSSSPPTFYPRGVAADCPTDVQSGEWVYTGDARDTRYFIPVRNFGKTPRQTLVNEALAARGDNKIHRIEAEDQAEHNDVKKRMLKKTPLVIIGTMLSFGSCPEWLVETDFETEWNSSKKPHE